jgi:leucyl/phenylalanyl-tRNA--protein transferase
MRLPWLGPDDPFPPLEAAFRKPNGLLAAGGGLSVGRLVAAYRHGCFPWYNEGEPLLWWSPDPRMVLPPSDLHVPRSLARSLRRGRFRVTADTAFRAVIDGCAAPRAGEAGTWITTDMIDAYVRLHEAGLAHSVEAWSGGDRLAGGLYGVSIGRVFFGESMFAREDDASKAAFVCLASQLARWDFGLIDCQMQTAHLARFGARPISRGDFRARLDALVDLPAPSSPWTLDPGLAEASGRPRGKNA